MKKIDRKDVNVLLGDPKAAIIALAMPMFVSYLVSQVNLYVDTFWTSGLGSLATSSISTVAPIYTIITTVGLGMSVGVTSTIAFRLGKGNKEQASLMAGNALLFGIVISYVASAAVWILFDPMMTFMGADDVRDLSYSYMLPYILMSAAVICNSIMAGLLRAEGAGTKSMIVLVVSAILNMAMDPLFIYILDMGVFGAALATTTSALLATLIGVSWYLTDRMTLKLTKSSFKFNKEALVEVLSVGAPKTADALINNVVILIQRVFVIAVAGTVGVMWFNLPWRYIVLVAVPSDAITSALIPVCAAAYGQKRVDKMKESISYCLKITFATTLILSVILFIFADPLMSVFTTESTMQDNKEMLVWVLKTYSLALFPYAFGKLASAMLQSIKKALRSTKVTLIWAAIKLGLLAIASQFSFEAIIYAMVLSHYVNFVVMMYFAVKETRKKFVLIEQENSLTNATI
ncbi:MAG: polysaccharide biosynthesis C-terminal domain-containing protein [archaeon]|nr:polysaccharide biosynthesis C-terminal domain-containing protein [archaeon]